MTQLCKRLIVVLFAIVTATIVTHAESSTSDTSYRNAVKITFLSWFSGSTKISYERAFSKCKQSGEICASMMVQDTASAKPPKRATITVFRPSIG